MARIFGHYVTLDMAVPCAVELSLSFALIYAMLTALGVPSHAGAELLALPSYSADLAAMLTCAIGVTSIATGLYHPATAGQRRELLRYVAIAGLAAFPAVLLVSSTFDIVFGAATVIWLGKVLIGWVMCVLLTRWIFSVTRLQDLFVRRVLLFGSGDRATRLRSAIESHRSRTFRLADPARLASQAFVSAREARDPRANPPSIAEPFSVAELRRGGIWGVVVAGDAAPDAALRLLDCKLRGMRVLDDVSFWEHHLGRINLDTLDAGKLLFAEGFETTRLGNGLKRVSDVLISLLLLFMTLPLMLLVAVLIKLDSPGPVLYRQQRVGLLGAPFVLFKFRSMAVDAEVGGQPRWASQRDPRVTRIGAFIRLSRIDELPQLINVLRGEMSLIGPRPERPHFVEQLARVIPFFHERSYVKPGITGWAQVNFPYGASVEDAREKLSYDLYYVKNRSLFLDLLILLSTVRVILFREGAR
jgi:sugar transferase (PEP-CTERM system associated)